MITDKRTEFALATAIGAGTGRRQIGDGLNQGAKKDAGSSSNVYLVVRVATTFTSAGAATLQLEFVSDAQDPPLLDTTATEHIVSPVFALAELTANKVLISQQLPYDGDAPYEQFLSIIGNVGTAAFTGGTLDAFLTLQPPVLRNYPDGKR